MNGLVAPVSSRAVGADSSNFGVSKASIYAAGVRRTFGDHVAVDHVDLAIPRGSIVGLVGPNGCGKTTLMLMLAGLLAPDHGEIRIAGHDLAIDGGAARAAIGWMPDSVGMWETLTAREILAHFAALYDVQHELTTQEVNERIDRLLHEVALEEFATKRVRVLSRGQKQRLSLARALIHNPPVLLLDEPASGMDPESRLALRKSLKTRAEAGTTILVSSHILPELEHIVDDIVMMRAGRTASSSTDLAGSRSGSAALDPVEPHEMFSGQHTHQPTTLLTATNHPWILASSNPAALQRWADASKFRDSIRPITAESVQEIRQLPGVATVQIFTTADVAPQLISDAVAHGVPVVHFSRQSLESRYFGGA